MPSAAILAGGRARRFDGRDKSSLVVRGLSIFERQIEEFAKVSDDILIVGGHLGPEDPSCPSWLRGDIRVREVPDRVKGHGPLGGLDAALAAARDDDLLVVACDMPFVTAAFLRHLLSLAGQADAVVPLTERGYHPLCALYTRACQAPVARRLAARQLSMAGFLEEVRVRVVQEHEIRAFGDPGRLLANVNTAVEFDELEALFGHEL